MAVLTAALAAVASNKLRWGPKFALETESGSSTIGSSDCTGERDVTGLSGEFCLLVGLRTCLGEGGREAFAQLCI